MRLIKTPSPKKGMIFSWKDPPKNFSIFFTVTHNCGKIMAKMNFWAKIFLKRKRFAFFAGEGKARVARRSSRPLDASRLCVVACGDRTLCSGSLNLFAGEGKARVARRSSRSLDASRLCVVACGDRTLCSGSLPPPLSK